MELARTGQIDVMIGPRSALFTLFPDLGLIIIDEEHEPSYKSEQVPAIMQGRQRFTGQNLEGASVVLGSATPSLEAYYRCRKGEYVLLELKRQGAGRNLPHVWIADMREELKKWKSFYFPVIS